MDADFDLSGLSLSTLPVSILANIDIRIHVRNATSNGHNLLTWRTRSVDPCREIDAERVDRRAIARVIAIVRRPGRRLLACEELPAHIATVSE